MKTTQTNKSSALTRPATMSNKFEPKKKRSKALWTTAYPVQLKKLYPENTASGGVKAQSGSKKVRDAIYSEIAKLFKNAFPWCETCVAIRGCKPEQAHATEDIHHSRGKTGLLYFDVRRFVPVCRSCHEFIHSNPAKAIELGISQKGVWDKLE